MFIDSRRQPEQSVETDVCIVGAGPAGITIATELAASGIDVCLLESGGFEQDPATQSLYDGTISGLPYTPLPAARVRYFGGTTNHWSGWCRPLDPIDFQHRDWVPYSGWPIGYSDLESYYTRAQELFGLSPIGFGTNAWAGGGSPTLGFDGSILSSPIFRMTAPARFGDMYRDRLDAADNVRVYLHANVSSLVSDPDGRQLQKVRVRTLSGGQFEVRAAEFVLATGGIENARLLLASTEVQDSGVGNDNDLVGRFFMDHPGITSGIALLSDPNQNLSLYTGASRDVSMVAKIDGGNMEQFIPPDEKAVLVDWVARGANHDEYQQTIEPVLKKYCVTCHNPQGIAFHRTLQTYDEVLRVAKIPAGSGDDLSTSATGNEHQALAGIAISASELARLKAQNYCALLEESRGWSEALGGDSIWQSVGNIAANFGSLTLSVYRKYFDEDARRQLVRIVNILEPSPNPESRVTLGAERDALGMRQVDLDWRLNDADRKTIADAHDLLAAELGRTGTGRLLREFDPDVDNWPDDMTHGWHHMGTTRMHQDRKHGVVDRDCRVHGVANLYIAGSSVFPTYGFAQPTFTIVALALRLAEHLKEMRRTRASILQGSE